MTKRRFDQLTNKMHKAWMVFSASAMERHHGPEWETKVHWLVWMGELIDQAHKYAAMGLDLKGQCPMVATVSTYDNQVFVAGNLPTPVSSSTNDVVKGFVEIWEHLSMTRKTLRAGIAESRKRTMRLLWWFCRALVTGDRRIDSRKAK